MVDNTVGQNVVVFRNKKYESEHILNAFHICHSIFLGDILYIIGEFTRIHSCNSLGLSTRKLCKVSNMYCKTNQLGTSDLSWNTLKTPHKQVINVDC